MVTTDFRTSNPSAHSRDSAAPRRLRRCLAVLAAALLGATSLTVSDATGAMDRGPEKETPPAEKSNFELGRDAARDDDCTIALKFLAKARDENPIDPDVHNLLGYCQRHVGQLEEAFASYAKALELRPRFAQAREYLGEAHIQAVLWQLRTLSDYGADSEEHLKKLVASFLRVADGLRKQFGDVESRSESPRTDDPLNSGGSPGSADAAPKGPW